MTVLETPAPAPTQPAPAPVSRPQWITVAAAAVSIAGACVLYALHAPDMLIYSVVGIGGGGGLLGSTVLTGAKVHQLQQSVGPANGETVTELLHRIAAFESYQHERNHDVLNELTKLSASVPLLLSALDKLEPAPPAPRKASPPPSSARKPKATK